jgi:hypothetical protein
MERFDLDQLFDLKNLHLTASRRPARLQSIGCGLWATFRKILILPQHHALTVFGVGPTMVA